MPLESNESVAPLILVVDDDSSVAEMHKSCLQYHGYRVAVASDGLQGLQKCLEQIPDLILLDICMPGLDGFQVCQALKEDSRTANIPIVLLSALSEPELKIRGFRLGVFDYLTKPCSQEELIARIRNILARERINKQTIEESKITTLRQLSVTLADRITNPLSEIMGCCQLLSRHLDDRDKTVETIEIIKASVDRIYSVLVKLSKASQVHSTDYSQGIQMIDLDREDNADSE